MGVVRDILYDKEKGPLNDNDIDKLPTQVIVEFPHYSDKPFFEEHSKSKWVPIVKLKLCCEKKCCFREGFLLAVQKAKTAHTTQGITVGENEQLTTIVCHLDEKMEQLMPNIHYTMFSRVKKRSNLAIATEKSITLDFVKKFGTFKVNKEQRAETNRLKEIADYGEVTIDMYFDALKWFMQEAQVCSVNCEEDKVYLDRILGFIANSISSVGASP